jgi:Zn finger protein HypA/HybF involved in hydrogenase expression
MKIIEQQKVEVTIRRPDGKIETLIHPKVTYMTTGILNQMNQAMKAANRGEVLSYRNIISKVAVEEVDHMVRCERCGKTINSRTAYKQLEDWQGKKVITYYCNSCKELLTSIGKGEYTAMQDRASQVNGYEPTNKEDY